MHRLIMNSEVYRRSALHPDRQTLAQKDPSGASYAVFKPRRLTAGELRDAMLSATGELNPALGGIPNRPEMNLEAALQPRQVMGTFANAWTPNPKPEQRHRRSLYAPAKASGPYTDSLRTGSWKRGEYPAPKAPQKKVEDAVPPADLTEPLPPAG